jgi:GT2 family glycosyltransferase
MDLSIIIVNYKSRDKVLACLDSIYASDLAGISFEIILVDNNSGDRFDDLAYDNLQVVYSAKNLGMGAGNNLGVAESSGEILLILNPDTIVRPSAIKTLYNYLKQDPRIGLVGPKLIYPDGELQASCAQFPSFFMPVLRRTFLGDWFKTTRDNFQMLDFDHRSIREVDWLMGSCLMLRKKDFPGFDHRYFMYFEDVDLARVLWRAGFKVVYNPEAVVVHDHRRDSAKYPWYFAPFKDTLAREHIKSWFKYFIKWGFKK